jgi:hypothetical protein
MLSSVSRVCASIPSTSRRCSIGPETFVSAEVPETKSQSPNLIARSKCPTGGASVSGL